jgi:SOS response associated peptidase (SRAP)
MTKIGRCFDGDGNLRSSFKPEAKHDALKATITLFAGEVFRQVGKSDANEEVVAFYNQHLGESTPAS